MNNSTIYISLVSVGLLILCINIIILIYIGIKMRDKMNSLINRVASIPGSVWDNANLYASVLPRRPLPKPGKWAASSDFLIHMTRLLELRQPKLVVELGSGLSTLIIAYALQRAGGGALISIEHDAHYAERTRTLLADHGLQDVAVVLVADLKLQAELPGDLPWYDLAAFNHIEKIDFLVIDGPPMAVGATARLPAVEAFAGRLTDGAIVLLDDADRPGEREIVRQWRDSHPNIEFSSIDTERGLAVGTKNGLHH